MSRKVNVGGTWKQVLRQHVNVGGAWKPVQRMYVNVGGTWKFAWARTPSAPTIAQLAINGSQATSQTTSSSPVSAEVTWTTPAAESGMPVQVQWLSVSSGQIGSTVDLAAGSFTSSTSLTVNSGQTADFYARVRYRNGQSTLSANDTFSNWTVSQTISVTRPFPAITSVSITKAPSTSDLSITWTVSDAPSSNAFYRVAWSDNLLNPTSTFLADVWPGQAVGLPFTTHGYQLYDAPTPATVSFYASVTLYINGVPTSAVGNGTAAFYTDAEA